MTIGEEVLIHGYIDEIRKDIVIIRNEGGYFGTVPEEIRSRSENPNTCEDAISRQAVFNLMRGLTRWCVRSEDGKWNNVGLLYDDVMFGIDGLPSVTPQQKTGRWIKQNYGWNWQCSECGFVTPPSAKEIFTFCPKCGAKMESEDKDSK